MQPPSPSSSLSGSAHPVDLLVVGGLTVDQFADGSRAPGGSVLHGTRAAVAVGFRVGVVTAAGDEPEARDGLRELRELGLVHAVPIPHSITFRHRERNGFRTLTLLERGARLAAPPGAFRPRGVLYAPVAAELGPELAGQLYGPAVTGATLQGWLRVLESNRPVAALELGALEPPLVARLGSLDVLVASDEDLAAVASDPDGQLAALRATFGPHPALALTMGARGALIEAGDGPRLVIVPEHVVAGGLTTGAGDAFAAVLTACLAAGRSLGNAAQAATAAAVAYLERG